MLPIEDRFWSRVVKCIHPECWQWVGAVDVYGYGQYNNRAFGTSKAHRIAWLLIRGPIPDGLTLDHLCRNKVCVNPDHLEPVTAEENHRRYREARTHCRNGHELGDGITRCPTCYKAKQKRGDERRRARRLAGDLLIGLPDDAHGKWSTYTSRGCRCELCKAAARAAGQAYRARKQAS